MKNLPIILFLTVLTAVSTFAQKTPSIVPVKEDTAPANKENVSTGKKYRNEIYNFALTFPENWTIPEDYKNEKYSELGYGLSFDAAKGVDLKTNGRIAQSIDHIKVLLSAYHSNAAGKTILRVSAEDLTGFPQIKDAVDYFDLMRESFKTMKLAPDFKYSETNAEKLGKKQFAFLDISSSSGKKRLYATVRDGYALMFTLEYKSDGDLQAFREILANGNFRIR